MEILVAAMIESQFMQRNQMIGRLLMLITVGNVSPLMWPYCQFVVFARAYVRS